MRNKKGSNGLKKVLGFPSLFAAAMGIVIAQTCFISVIQGAAMGGSLFLAALLIAFVLTLSYSATFSELSLMLPKAGGISTYTLTALGPFTAIIATFSGYIIPNILLTPAELYLMEKLFVVLFPGSIGFVGIILIILFTVLNLLGIDIFSTVQNILAYTLLVSLAVIGVSGMNHAPIVEISVSSILKDFHFAGANTYSLVALALFAFLGLEFICPLLEETKDPEKNIPKTFLIASFVLLVVYGMLAFISMRLITPGQALGSEIPHWLLVEILYGRSGTILMAIIAITATSTSVNTIIASVPRMMYGMAHHGQLPPIFMKIHPKFKTPWFSILTFSFMIIFIGGIFRHADNFVMLLLISATLAWLLTYIIAHIDLIVLRRKYPNYKRPFKSPFYPWFQVIGIAGMLFAVINNSPSPELTGRVYTIFAVFTGIAAVYAFFWVRYRMKRGLFETEPIEEALTD